MQKIRWGILSTGFIAGQFARGLSVIEDAELVAVGSRTQASAAAFGAEFNIPNCHASYEELAHDPDVDAIYIGTPHAMHQDNITLCLNAGKHVLCEKPFTINAQQAQTVVALAREKNLFLMEAMWMRFLPIMAQVRAWVADGKIGAIQMIKADFCFRTQFDAQHRLFNPKLGGGALLDVGIYPISLTAMLLGLPQTIRSHVHLGATGVDEQNALLFEYANGAAALLTSAVRTYMPFDALIVGENGHIYIPNFFKAERAVLTMTAGATPGTQTVEIPHKSNGYEYQAMAVGDCLRANQRESAIMPLDETIALMHLMDTIRAEWGLVYPMEK
jgi:predicted dehydrogenase